MRIAESQLRRMIKEIAAVPTGQVSGGFGKYAFSPQRQKLGNDRRPPGEDNTASEERAFKALWKHVVYDQFIESDSVAALKRALRSGLYSDFLFPPAQEEVYRGISITRSELRRQRLPIPDNGTKISFVGKFIQPVREGAASPASSWTLDKKVAESFSSHHAHLQHPEVIGDDEQIFGMVMTARISDNPHSFLSMNPFYEIDREIGRFRGDEEVIGLGKIVCSEIDIDSPLLMEGIQSPRKRIYK